MQVPLDWSLPVLMVHPSSVGELCGGISPSLPEQWRSICPGTAADIMERMLTGQQLSHAETTYYPIPLKRASCPQVAGLWKTSMSVRSKSCNEGSFIRCGSLSVVRTPMW